MKTAAEWKQFYENKDFEAAYTYEGRLGAEASSTETIFRLWSPVAESVELRLYEDGAANTPYSVLPMERQKKGVWQAKVDGNLHGTYYDFNVIIEGQGVRTADPYAYGCGANGSRSMVVDHAKASPIGWDKDSAPERPPEDVIYELHIKDFSWDKNGGFVPEHRGKYLAFTDENTTLHSDGMHRTGLAYLKELGITHVEWMPVFDFASIDETGDDEQYNWGYDPQNYFVPEGSYATDSRRGETRILELKEAVLALHKAGLRVVMDVVFNHSFSLDNSLQKTCPWYYYRQYEDGRLSNGTGCGNDLASERSMCRRLILDCVLYWAKEYHMDGFRFDLMGLLDIELMNEIRRRLDDLYGVGEKLMLGEPWSAGQTAIEGHPLLAVKSNFDKIDPNIAYFSDDIRDNIKGSIFHPREAGFANGGKGREEAIVEAFGAYGLFASQIVSYVSCHDNQTLWDKLIETTEDETLRRKEYALAVAVYLTAPGHLFFLAGEEFLRTKDGYSNTYNAPAY
ncbi:MAG: type I pullulanase, partial [Lachnospiraceae bacterium]|nr:type I pullulanase [Lachnospiraceae bacterium]